MISYSTIRDEAAWDAFFEHVGVKPILVLYENFAADQERSTRVLLERLGLDAPRRSRNRR